VSSASCGTIFRWIIGFDVSAGSKQDEGMSTTYLVTGCAGFIGSHLSEALLERGASVIGVDSFTDYYDSTLKEGNLSKARMDDRFRLVSVDLATDDLEPYVAEVDAVFHLAAQPGVRGSWGDTFRIYARDNIVATQRLFEAVVAQHRRIVWASTSSVYGNAATYPTREDARPRPISPYGVTKLGCEHLAEAYAESFGLDHAILRYFTVYGPRQRPDMAFTKIIRALATGGPFEVFGSGEQSRDVTYVGDAVAATIAAMEHGASGAVYNVGGGSETTLNEVIALCEELSGRTLDRRVAESAAGDVRRTSADTTRARLELGWRPRTSLADGLRAQLQWGQVPLIPAPG
jgi:nucleoside-diphosphate-sugar epimerase